MSTEEFPRLKPLRFSFECAHVGRPCTLKLEGERDDVLAHALAHARAVHEDKRPDDELQREIEAALRQEAIEWLWSGIDPAGPLSDRPSL